MDVLTTTASAATVASLLTSLAKFGFPNLPSYAVMAISLFAGVLASFLVAFSGAAPVDVQHIAQNVLTGILAAGVASGVSRADRSADVVREAAKMGAYEGK
jgi:hypothetical protein